METLDMREVALYQDDCLVLFSDCNGRETNRIRKEVIKIVKELS